MSRERARIGFEDALTGFDPADWKPAAETRAKPPMEDTRAIAEATGFRSREDRPPANGAGQGAPAVAMPAPVAAPVVAPDPARPEPARPVRRRRTGRNAQFNLKARPDTIDRFCAVADGQGWGLGETLEYAVALLEERYGGKR